MKKVLAAAVLAAIIGFGGLQTADAGWGWGGGGRGYGPGAGPGACGSCDNVLSEEDQKARQEFFDETKDLREKLFNKRNEYAEVMGQKSPDKDQAAAIWSEMYDIKAELREKAEAAGFGPSTGKGLGRGTCDGSGDCNIRGGKGGRGCNGPRW